MWDRKSSALEPLGKAVAENAAGDGEARRREGARPRARVRAERQDRTRPHPRVHAALPMQS